MTTYLRKPRFFPCCLVAELVPRGTACWVCEESTISYYDGDLKDEFEVYNGYSSRGQFFQFSLSEGDNPFGQKLPPR